MLRTDLYMADEAFLSGTAAEVVPIAIGRRPRRRRRASPGRSPARSRRCYFAIVRGEVDQYKDWLEYVDAEQLPPAAVEIYDTTLRDGSQQEGSRSPSTTSCGSPSSSTISASPTSKAGWPGANPKDDEFFRRAATELQLQSATLVAFGSTRRSGIEADRDETLRHLVDAGTEAVCIVAKASDYHVTEALRTTLDEGVAMVADSVAYLRRAGLGVFFDAEHFFDGYRRNPEFALRVLEGRRGRPEPRRSCSATPTAARCPDEVERIVAEVASYARRRRSARHFHNDGGCAVANTLAGGARGRDPGAGLRQRLRRAHRATADLSADHPEPHAEDGRRDDPGRPARAPHAGRAPHRRARQHDARPPAALRRDRGVRPQGRACTRARIARRPDAYEHVPPDVVGNGTRFVVSELAGRSTLQLKAAELGLELDSPALGEVLDTLKHLEHEGYHFEVADGSLELLDACRDRGWEQLGTFRIESFRVITDWRATRWP